MIAYKQWKTDDNRLFTQLMISMEPSVEDIVKNTNSVKELWEVLAAAYDGKCDLSRIYDLVVRSTELINGTSHIRIISEALRSWLMRWIVSYH